jgi:hypothetical protein
VIACEDIRLDSAEPRQVTLVNLIGAIRSVDQPPFPLLYRELCVFGLLTECRGSAEVEIRIVQADTGELAYAGPPHPWTAPLPNDPLEVVGLRFRVRNISFPAAGLYWIEFCYNGDVLTQEPLLVE